MGFDLFRPIILRRIGRQILPKMTAAMACGGGAEVFWQSQRGSSEALGGSAEAERKHSLDVPSHGDEAPLAANPIEPAQQELAESHHRFDDAEHWFRSLLAQAIELFALRCPQTPGHGLDRCRVVRRGRWRCKPLAPGG